MNYAEMIGKIFVMAGVTYLIRMLPLTFFEKKITNPFVLSFIYYVPYAVLSAMTFPAILNATGHLLSGCIALGTGAFFAFRGKSLLTVAVVTCAGAFAGELICLLI